MFQEGLIVSIVCDCCHRPIEDPADVVWRPHRTHFHRACWKEVGTKGTEPYTPTDEERMSAPLLVPSKPAARNRQAKRSRRKTP